MAGSSTRSDRKINRPNRLTVPENAQRFEFDGMVMGITACGSEAIYLLSKRQDSNFPYESCAAKRKNQSATSSAPKIYLGFLFITSQLASTAARANVVDRGKAKGSCRTRKNLFV